MNWNAGQVILQIFPRRVEGRAGFYLRLYSFVVSGEGLMLEQHLRTPNLERYENFAMGGMLFLCNCLQRPFVPNIILQS